MMTRSIAGCVADTNDVSPGASHVQVTEAMIEAGRDILSSFDAGLDSPTQTVIDLYRAMWRARPEDHLASESRSECAE
jgi:hypothetical protein